MVEKQSSFLQTRHPTSLVVEMDKNGNLQMAEQWSRNIGSSYITWVVIYLQAQRVNPRNLSLQKRAYPMVVSEYRRSKQQLLLNWTLQGLQFSTEPEEKTKAAFIDATGPITSVDLLKLSGAAFRALWDVIYSMCKLHIADLREFEELPKLEYGESIQVSANFMFGDPLYMCHCLNDEGFEHDKFSADKMKAMVELYETALKPKGHGDLFGTVLLFRQQYPPMSWKSEKEEIVHDVG